MADTIGLAQASLRVMFDIDVVLEGPKDGILLLLWRNQLLDSGCLWDQGPATSTSAFLHQTRGRIAYANLSGDREASFSERLTLRAGTAASDPTQSVGGRLQVQLRNLQTTAEISASGDWSVNDLQSFGPTPTSQLGLYPGADARNALDDPRGDLQGWTFSHSELLTIPVRFKVLDSTAAALATQLTGRVTAELDQQAIAGSRRFVYSASTLSVDFADTSTFSFAQITDPAGIVDFSQARVSLVAAPGA